MPRQLLHPKKKTVGVRIPDHVVTQALLAELGEPLLSSTLLLPDEDEPMTQGWEIKERLDHVVDAVVDSGDCGTEPTTVDRLLRRRGRDRPPGRRRPVPVRVGGRSGHQVDADPSGGRRRLLQHGQARFGGVEQVRVAQRGQWFEAPVG